MTDQHSPPLPPASGPADVQGYWPQQGYAPRPSTGVRHWAWQLLYWAPIPLVPLLVVPFVLLGLRGGAVRNGGIDEANSRAAMNWSLTWLIAVLTMGLLHFGLLFSLTGGGGSVSGASPMGVVLAITASLLGVAYIGGGIMTLINVIRGWAAAARGEAARPLFAIAFLRAAPSTTGGRAASVVRPTDVVA